MLHIFLGTCASRPTLWSVSDRCLRRSTGLVAKSCNQPYWESGGYQREFTQSFIAKLSDAARKCDPFVAHAPNMDAGAGFQI